MASIIIKVFCIGLLTVGCSSRQAVVTDHAAPLPNSSLSHAHGESSGARGPAETHSHGASGPNRAGFGQEHRSLKAQRVADWVVDLRDNGSMPFVIVDKADAKVFVFHPDGRLRGAAPALLGLAQGDDSLPDIGDRKLSEISPQDRTTPAGRFVASLGTNFHGKDVLWVDYDTALSLHRVVTSNPKERRLERLATPTPLDNRISYGCINVPADFFNDVVKPAFHGTYGVVYVLPEARSNSEVFASYYDIE